MGRSSRPAGVRSEVTSYWFCQRAWAALRAASLRCSGVMRSASEASSMREPRQLFGNVPTTLAYP